MQTWFSSQVQLFHRLLVLLLQVAIQGYVLVDGERLTASMARDQLQFGIGQLGMTGQPRNRLMPESMRRRFDPSLVCILLDNLLYPTGTQKGVRSGFSERLGMAATPLTGSRVLAKT
jgi:hypothetical protein